MPAWPINLEDRPNVPKQLDALLRKLAVGRDTVDPYDVPRSRTRDMAAPKEAAIRLISIIDALDRFGWTKEDFEMMQAEFVALPDKYDMDRRAGLTRSHMKLVNNCYETAARRLDEFAAFLEVENPFRDREAVYQESRTCHSLNEVVSKDAWATKGIELLEKFAGGQPERCRVFRGIGNKKAEATLREAGQQSGPLPPRSIANGLRGQVKSAFKFLRRANGTLGTPPHISWSSRETIETFLATRILPDEQMAIEAGFVQKK